MDDSRYRVILSGELVNGFSREAVIAALARLFETSAGKLVGIFDGGEYPIDELFDAAGASALQQRLEDIGAHARVERVRSRPATTGELHLPRHGSPSEAGLMRCPACGHEQLVARQCDECGVVFAEFNRQAAARPRPTPSVTGASRSPRPQRKKSQAVPPRDIHAREAHGWQDAWVDDGNDIPAEEYHVNLYMGRAGAHLAEYCKRMMLGRRTHLSLSWAGGAVISPFLWAMYRKMWGWAIVIFVAEILLPVLLIALGSEEYISNKLTYLGIAGIVANRLFWPALLKYLYCRHTRKMIVYMNRMSPTFASDIDIATAGGASKTSVFVGIVLAIVAALLTWNIVDTVYARMMKATPVYVEPSPLPSNASSQTRAKSADDRLVTDNKWVLTRNRLRVLGQRVSTWLRDTAPQYDPADLSIEDIGEALLLDADSVLDGWGNQFVYRYQNNGFALVSAGPDGEFGSSDDIRYRRSLAR